MIIEDICLENFGLFGDETHIDLMPQSGGERNIVVISGKNGVGKSTLQEAINLCLLGSLSINSRISEQNYENYLVSRCHKNTLLPNVQAKISVCFQFFKSGLQLSYRVLRTWNSNVNDVNEELYVWENGDELSDLSKKEKNLFLRELIQPGFARVIFFDGEQLSSLFESGNLPAFIQESCNYLFGINFIELLKSDLNHFTNKLLLQQSSVKDSNELIRIEDELSQISDHLESLFREKEEIELQLTNLRNTVSEHENNISKQGRWIASKSSKLQSERQKVEIIIENLKREIVELYSGLGPFSFCKDVLSDLQDRLILEREIERWNYAADLLKQKADAVDQMLIDRVVMQNLSLPNDAVKTLSKILREAITSVPDKLEHDQKIYHHISEHDRAKLLNWIDSINTITVARLKEKTQALTVHEGLLKTIIKEQATFTKDEILQPLLKALQDANKAVSYAEQRTASVIKKINEQLSKKNHYSNLQIAVQKKLAEMDSNNSKTMLAYKTTIALGEYVKIIVQKKLSLLESATLKKLSSLCRKENYFNGLTINPEDFSVHFEINGRLTEHNQLSAGEKQLFILALLWGLREITNARLPLIIDTPISRLDAEHRSAFINDFLPNVRPQVILIGTDTEIMQGLLQPIADKISYHYKFSYDRDSKSNRVSNEPNLASQSISDEI
ncbi:MAG TPA: DNA sulfur modification protein DndD [Candidatus Babeliaceae bacterium]|nr:DNA sulfur modification protein DndD [Candidatus Babeliaceae bacterium]